MALFRVRVPANKGSKAPETHLADYRKNLSSSFIEAGGKKGKACISSMSIDESCSCGGDVLCVRVNGKMTDGQRSMLRNLDPA